MKQYNFVAEISSQSNPNKHYTIKVDEHGMFSCNCFPEGTFILGANKNIEDLVVGDNVVNIKTDIISQVLTRQVNEDLLCIKATGLLPISCTCEHPFFVVEHYRYGNGYRFSEPLWKLSGQLEYHNRKKSNYLLIPRLKTTHVVKMFDLTKYVKAPEWRNRGTRQIKLSQDFAMLCGWYVAEGSKNSNGFTLDFNNNKDRSDALQVQSYVNSMGIGTSDEVVGNCYRLTIHNEPLARFMSDHFGRGAENKKIPNWILMGEELLAQEAKNHGHSVTLLYGTANNKRYPISLDIKAVAATEDGTVGHQGMVA